MIRISTGHLVAMLTDLVHTAGDPALSTVLAGVLLHSTRGHLDGDPGATTLLVGTSSTGHIVGHTYAHCSGSLPPTLWPIGDVRAVIASFKPLVRDNKDHAVEINADAGVIAVAEDPNLLGEGLKLSFTGGDVAEYPPGVWRLLTDVPLAPPARADGTPPMTNAPRTDLLPSALGPFLAIAKRRNSAMEFYRNHQHVPVQLQIGPRYRGVLKPERWDDESRDAGIAPAGDVYPLDPSTVPS